MTHKIAVTGVGGGSGQGILKALLDWNPTLEVYPVDVTPISAGLYWPGCMPGKVLPKPEDDIDAWKRWIAQEGIDLVIPGADRDLPPLAAVAQEWRQNRICRVAVSSEKMIEMAGDKLLTSVDLAIQARLNFPWTYWPDAPVQFKDVQDWAEGRYPVIVKPRFGAASRGFVVCGNVDELMFYWKRTPDPMAQEYIEGDEYTCALFFDIDHEPRAKFAMRRWLRNGDTYRAEVVQDERIDAFLDDVGRKLRRFNPFGPINVQFRDVPERGPVILELNARCSGSSVMRAHFGYNEPKMLVQHILERLPINQPRTRTTGFAFRAWNEIYLDGMNFDQLLIRPSERVGQA